MSQITEAQSVANLVQKPFVAVVEGTPVIFSPSENGSWRHDQAEYLLPKPLRKSGTVLGSHIVGTGEGKVNKAGTFLVQTANIETLTGSDGIVSTGLTLLVSVILLIPPRNTRSPEKRGTGVAVSCARVPPAAVQKLFGKPSRILRVPCVILLGVAITTV